MKTLDRLKAIAVAGFVILLLFAETCAGGKLIVNTNKQYEFSFTNQKLLRIVDTYDSEEEICANFGSEFVDKLKINTTLRETFFAEMTENLYKEFTIEILAIEIFEKEYICIRYIQDVNKQNPRQIRLAQGGFFLL
ncbi:MAG: hypothetical protein UW27_C0004G0034 [Parcubacteria group bacterium GW2011_GWA1_44_13]|uniref:Uncharacterized protein n=1 Tax=Candidatus Nomurabacteria bacterium GW2011_GWB1_44_12 TaxID=1618748 RepID=A0A837I9J2_9BACT|nr:MAG: hypothetical protein UW17_C0044G0007 [Candidatus Nomurabacteria bacterium GW2011_GWD1_44_10]KKT36552.1 MAG: hypothetical protein UW25_C0005G0034 [Candidatus Nomurabacteria bacterium GW2011_GWB1_44_12]KKT38179.1 MAG: hypothetical protein UW27_C0004G0034 [Parcubacteria group bacterium GW2011_GWA1_44_13]KKT59575.1 MAG: hypothetical protein UW54_C0023G0007 [Parcubacteria group bacterium GW2011_GWC1_44_26]HBB43838.1 hypothetical protein [Candidatus Yonathbacteria bacterium]